MTGTSLLALRNEPLSIRPRAHAPGFGFRAATKRGIDLAVALVLSIMTLPLVLAMAVLSVVLFREWPFFVQERIGQHGERLAFVKIRTMSSRAVDAYAVKTDWSTDAIPPVMRKIRALHLDEFPQLWLVVAGRLSLVGPRPKMPDDVEPVDPEYGRTRTMVPQGCTCLWQIGGQTSKLPRDVPGYDYLYLVSGGLRLDLWIVACTALQMVGIIGSREITDVPRWARSRGWYDLSIRRAA